MGHKVPVIRPRCTGPGRARTQTPFNSIQWPLSCIQYRTEEWKYRNYTTAPLYASMACARTWQLHLFFWYV